MAIGRRSEHSHRRGAHPAETGPSIRSTPPPFAAETPGRSASSLLDYTMVNGSDGRTSRGRLRRGPLLLSIVVAAFVAGLLFLAALPANAAAHSVTVSSTEKFTPAGITVSKGDTITVTASGHVHFGGNQI